MPRPPLGHPPRAAKQLRSRGKWKPNKESPDARALEILPKTVYILQKPKLAQLRAGGDVARVTPAMGPWQAWGGWSVAPLGGPPAGLLPPAVHFRHDGSNFAVFLVLFALCMMEVVVLRIITEEHASRSATSMWFDLDDE